MSKIPTLSNDKLLRVLSDIGLDEKESHVYLAALTLGPTSILKISNLAGVKRTTVYSVLGSLRHKGLVTVEVRGFRTRYVASPPSALRSVVANKLTLLDDVMPDLAARFNMSGGGAVIRQYQGLAATKGLYEELLESMKSNDPYYVVTDLAMWESLDAKFFASFVRRRESKNIRLHVLSTPSKAALRRKDLDRQGAGHFRILPATVAVTTNLIITPHHVVFHQLVPPMDAILLNNKSVINLQIELFKAIWDSCGQ